MADSKKRRDIYPDVTNKTICMTRSFERALQNEDAEAENEYDRLMKKYPDFSITIVKTGKIPASPKTMEERTAYIKKNGTKAQLEEWLNDENFYKKDAKGNPIMTIGSTDEASRPKKNPGLRSKWFAKFQKDIENKSK